MIENKIWTQTELNNTQEILDRTIEQFICCLDLLLRFYNYSDFENDNQALKVLNNSILEEVTKLIKERGIDFEKNFYNEAYDNKISKLDIYKLFITSSHVYHFWNMPFKGLLKFYKENLKLDTSINVDLFIGRLKYLVEINEKDFINLEKYIILLSKIDT
jgi:hypothetical protein